MPVTRALLLAALLVAGAPVLAAAQVFLAERPNPPFTIGPVFLRATVTPDLGDVPVDVLFSLVVPPGRSGADLAQNIFLLWPGAVAADPAAGVPDPKLAAQVQEMGFSVIEEGRLALSARNLYERGPDGRRRREPLAGGAPFVTVVREGGALDLSAPATFIRIPWDPRHINRAYLVGVRLPMKNAIKAKPATWFERTFWGQRYRMALSFGDIRQRAMFPLYFWHRDRLIKLSEDPSQITVNFTHADQLKIDEMDPQAARRQRHESLENTETVSVFLEGGEGVRAQTLSLQFGYFSGLQGWAPVLVPVLFFVLGNLAGVMVRGMAERLFRDLSGRFHFGRGGPSSAGRDTGVVVPRETLARIVPGETRHADVLRLIGPDPEEHESLAAPEQRRLIYRGRRIVPRPRRAFGWFATVDSWDVEHHELEISLERDVVSDIQARVRRAHLPRPDA